MGKSASGGRQLGCDDQDHVHDLELWSIGERAMVVLGVGV